MPLNDELLTTVKSEPVDTESYAQFNEPVDVLFDIKRENNINIEFVTPNYHATHETNQPIIPLERNPLFGTNEDLFIEPACVKDEITFGEYQLGQSDSDAESLQIQVKGKLETITSDECERKIKKTLIQFFPWCTNIVTLHYPTFLNTYLKTEKKNQ